MLAQGCSAGDKDAARSAGPASGASTIMMGASARYHELVRPYWADSWESKIDRQPRSQDRKVGSRLTIGGPPVANVAGDAVKNQLRMRVEIPDQAVRHLIRNASVNIEVGKIGV